MVIAVIISRPKEEGARLSGEQQQELSTGNEYPGIDYEIAGAPTEEDVNAYYALTMNENLQDARVEIPGASPISQDNKIMTYEGEVADNSVAPGSALAPKVTQNLTEAQLPNGTLLLSIDSNGFNPNQINARAGEPVTIALKNIDSKVHVFMFDDPSLKAIAIPVMEGELKAITFNAPPAGTYTFRCDFPGHKEGGEVGTLIVR